jgi:hypothetical protein
MLKIVNMIPNGWSDEENQDCEPNLSVNPANPHQIIGTTFTYDNPAGTSAVSPAMSGNWAPLFSSTDGGNTWSLEFVLPSGTGEQYPTWDVTSRYAGSGDELYSGLIRAGSHPATIDINRAPNAATQQVTFATAIGDQPFLETTTALGQDKLYVGYNQNNANSTSDVFLDANAASPTFTSNLLDVRNSFDMPPTRTAIHSSGTIYCAFYSNNSDGTRDVVVVKDLNWGGSVPPFHALIDGGDGKAGVRVAISISNPWPSSDFLDPKFGNDRFGPDLAIAVDPHDASRIFIAYVTGTGSVDDVLHLRSSVDGGQNWSPDVRTVPVAKNPSIAINTLGMVGFVYQQVVGANWVSVLEKSDNGFTASFSSHILATTPTNTPAPAPLYGTYLGDYIKLQAIGKDFYGTFCAGNAPIAANFPSGVTYQRNVNWTTQTLLANDDVTPVAASIDPFFFKLTVDVPGIATAIADSGNFGNVCVGSFADEMLTINNHGSGTLWISKITSTSADFEVPSVLSYPLEVAPGASIDLMIRFKPAGFGSVSGKIEIFSNAAHSPHVVDVSGEALAGKIAVSGSLCFGGVKACCRAERTLTICNTGDCSLSVTSVAFKRKSPYWKLINNPFPATLHPGSCMGIVIRYKAMEKCPTACELVIESNDPTTPVKTLDVMAYTIWNQRGCAQCCNDCQKGCCSKHDQQCCCEGGADDCWQDENGDDKDC